MKTAFVILMVLLRPVLAFSQYTLSGYVSDKTTGEPLPGAAVSIQNTFLVKQAGPDGDFSFTALKAGSYTVSVSFLGYAPAQRTVSLRSDTELDIALEMESFLTEEVIVT